MIPQKTQSLFVLLLAWVLEHSKHIVSTDPVILGLKGQEFEPHVVGWLGRR